MRYSFFLPKQIQFTKLRKANNRDTEVRTSISLLMHELNDVKDGFEQKLQDLHKLFRFSY